MRGGRLCACSGGGCSGSGMLQSLITFQSCEGGQGPLAQLWVEELVTDHGMHIRQQLRQEPVALTLTMKGVASAFWRKGLYGLHIQATPRDPQPWLVLRAC